MPVHCIKQLNKSAGLLHVRFGCVDPGVRSDVVVHDVVVGNLEVAVVSRDGVVELWCHCSHLGEESPGDLGEVVMLDVVAEVEVENIRDSKVIVALLSLHKLVVLSNRVHSHGMKTHTHVSCKCEVE